MRSALSAACCLALLLGACRDGGAEGPAPAPTATAAATPEATSSPTGTTSATSTPAVTATPRTPSPGARSITGLFTEPRPLPPPHAERGVSARPAPTFAPWDRVDVVLYDIVARTGVNLGPGQWASFSPDGRWLAWNAGDLRIAGDVDEVWVREIASGEQRSLGEGWIPQWLDAERLVVRDPRVAPNYPDRFEAVEVISGARQEFPGFDPNILRRPPREAGGWYLQVLPVAPGSGYRWKTGYRLADAAGRLAPLEFEAFRAVLAEDGSVVIATPPRLASGGSPDIQSFTVDATTNIFAVDPANGTATFVATSRVSAANWPLDAGAGYIAWTDGYCGADARTQIFERATGRRVALDRGLWLVVTPRGELGVGEFGPQAFIDIASLAYTVVLPENAIDVRATADYRYLALAAAGGHGGLCP